ncbi:DUSAM domain-containing protein [Corallococcus interemptor]|uniref:DUSAM domain-containing protein n=1 Tax=Corallococcus interemptor TaxID=2316720 RepID=UPI003D064DCB
MPDPKAWDEIWELNRSVSELGQPLTLTASVCALLRSTASDVAIPAEEAERALQAEASAAALLAQIAQRIREGSRRLSRALNTSYQRQQTGDTEGARQPMLDVLAVEVVPHYREIAQTQLDALDED